MGLISDSEMYGWPTYIQPDLFISSRYLVFLEELSLTDLGQ